MQENKKRKKHKSKNCRNSKPTTNTFCFKTILNDTFCWIMSDKIECIRKKYPNSLKNLRKNKIRCRLAKEIRKAYKTDSENEMSYEFVRDAIAYTLKRVQELKTKKTKTIKRQRNKKNWQKGEFSTSYILHLREDVLLNILGIMREGNEHLVPIEVDEDNPPINYYIAKSGCVPPIVVIQLLRALH